MTKQRRKTSKMKGGTRIPNPRPRGLRNYRNRLVVTFQTEIGEITSTFNFGRQEAARAAFDALLGSYSVAGISLFLNGKFQGGRDGLGS